SVWSCRSSDLAIAFLYNRSSHAIVGVFHPFFFSNPTPTTEIYPLSLHDALPILYSSRISLRGRSAASLRQNCVTVFSFSKNHFSSPSGRWSIVLLISSWGSTL